MTFVAKLMSAILLISLSRNSGKSVLNNEDNAAHYLFNKILTFVAKLMSAILLISLSRNSGKSVLNNEDNAAHYLFNKIWFLGDGTFLREKKFKCSRVDDLTPRIHTMISAGSSTRCPPCFIIFMASVSVFAYGLCWACVLRNVFCIPFKSIYQCRNSLLQFLQIEGFSKSKLSWNTEVIVSTTSVLLLLAKAVSWSAEKQIA